MATIIQHIGVIFFLGSLLHLCSSSSEKELEYEKWISWNKHNYLMKKKITAIESVRGVKLVDVKLRNAEMNKFRVSVCQNGTGNFMSIREALASIQLHNTRRIILDIGPGVYRYIYIFTGFRSNENQKLVTCGTTFCFCEIKRKVQNNYFVIYTYFFFVGKRLLCQKLWIL